MDKFSYMSNGDVEAIESLYQEYRKDPESVDHGWKKFFEGFEFARTDFDASEDGISENVSKEFKVINLINAYRSRGHLFTKTNPVRERRKYSPTLDLENFGLDKNDLQTTFQAGKEVGIGEATLQQILDHLNQVYCLSVGIEYMYIRHPERVDWLRGKIEDLNKPIFSKDQRKQILKKLTEATGFEQFLQKKFVGQKRFSLEGGESLIPALDTLIEGGTQLGVSEFVVGMAHRGRLNVLANIFHKSSSDIFSEFVGKEYDDEGIFDGDVKYHLGYSCDLVADTGKDVRLTLAPNPSHLEAVDPVVEGIARSKIDDYLKDEKKIVPVLIHGDAAIAGQGIVFEVIQMAQLKGYRTGGTIHMVVNNQIGFTTNYLDARSSTYCTDAGKATLSPVFHVNADDVEAVVRTVELALQYRQAFGADVFIDLLGYRKYGHNEGDEPKFTQPKLYSAIAKQPNPRKIYVDKLVESGEITSKEADQLEKEMLDHLENELSASKKKDKSVVIDFLADVWEKYPPATIKTIHKEVDTSVDKKILVKLGKKLATLPKDKAFFRKVKKVFADRLKMIEENSLDWGMAEMLAYASLLEEGHPIRLSGQDVERGTFSHRHAVLKTEDDEEEYIPLNNLSSKQGFFHAYNSLLSEYGVLGFDYGYAMNQPNALTIWEAQFGDFNNGAQIIIDQFISAAEDKWRTQNGLVMFLPHGYEGMGSEHSSGRMERYLSLCGENNIQVLNCTTPASFFHALRRQMKRKFRKPLVIFTPKMLLRYPQAVSTLEDLSKGGFMEVIEDDSIESSKVERLVFCTGKLYYELLEERKKKKGSKVALVRVEQLYPLPIDRIEKVIAGCKNAKSIVWAQEEPENMGAWAHILRKMRNVNWEIVSRPSSGSPAAGSPKIHEERQKKIYESVLNHKK